MNELAEQKRLLVARSERYREAIAVELHHIQDSFLWIPRTIQLLRWASPALAMAAPILGALLGKKISRKPVAEAATPARKSLLTKIVSAVQLYRKVKFIVDAFRPAR